MLKHSPPLYVWKKKVSSSMEQGVIYAQFFREDKCSRGEKVGLCVIHDLTFMLTMFFYDCYIVDFLNFSLIFTKFYNLENFIFSF